MFAYSVVNSGKWGFYRSSSEEVRIEGFKIETVTFYWIGDVWGVIISIGREGYLNLVEH